MQIIQINENNLDDVIERAVKILRTGGIVIYPTETCYGIGVDATNQAAVDKILKYKTKRKGKPMSVAVTGKKMAEDYVEVNEIAANIYDNYLPGPITVVSTSKGKVAKGVESPENTLGIRIPDHIIISAIVEKLGKPVTSTSANVSYKKTPYCVSDILDNATQRQLDLIDLIIDYGELPHNPPSTVVDTTLNSYTVVRQGEIKFEHEQKYVSKSSEDTQKIGGNLMKKYRHYLGYKSVVFAMQGELGAGKTQMTKGIASELGVSDTIKSPTFIIEANYEIPKPEDSFLASRKVELIHIDTWRLASDIELIEMDFIKQVENCNVFVIEWADKVSGLLDSIKTDAVLIWIRIDYSSKENERHITVSY